MCMRVRACVWSFLDVNLSSLAMCPPDISLDFWNLHWITQRPVSTTAHHSDGWGIRLWWWYDFLLYYRHQYYKKRSIYGLTTAKSACRFLNCSLGCCTYNSLRSCGLSCSLHHPSSRSSGPGVLRGQLHADCKDDLCASRAGLPGHTCRGS